MTDFDGRRTSNNGPIVYRGDAIFRDHQQQQQQLQRHTGGGPPVGNNNRIIINDGSQPLTFVRHSKSSGDFSRDMSNNRNNNQMNRNQGWAEGDTTTPNPYRPAIFSRRISQDSGVTQIRRNTKSYGDFRGNNPSNVASALHNSDPNEGYDTDVSNNPRPRTADVGGGKQGRLDVSNTSRIIAERKRRTTGSSTEKPQSGSMRRATSAADFQATGGRRRRTSFVQDWDQVNNRTAEMQPNKQPMRRVNTATGELQRMGGHNVERKRRTTNAETQSINPMRRVNTATGDLRAVEEHEVFRGSHVSEINDEFTDPVFNPYNPVSRRRSSENASTKSNEHAYPSGVAGRRRPTGGDGGRRRSRAGSGRRSSSGSGNNPQSGSASDVDEYDQRRPTGMGSATDDFQQQLHQLRVNHHRQQQQQPPQERRRSSMSSSDRSLNLDDEMAIMSAPLGGRLSNYGQDMNNPNQQMGALLREMQQLETQTQRRHSEFDKSEHSWYLGRDASRSDDGKLGPLGISHHSKAYSLGISHHSKAHSATSGSMYLDFPTRKETPAPSDRTNDPRLFNDLLQGKQGGNGRLRWHEKHSLSKRTIIIAVGLIILAVAILGVVLYLSERGIGLGGNGGSEIIASKNSTKPAATAAVNYVIPPPSDIDGRCSASNLPGSLPACLEACYPAACCYNSFNGGKKCFDASDSESIKACKRYRPYCDIFHDTWDGATDGVLRTPQVNLVPICQQRNGKDEEQSSKLRARNLLSRNLMVGTASDICDQYCEAAKCCALPTVLHPYSAGLELSSSGVYTDARTKEHVVTNCQDDLVYQKNKDLCAEYDKFCKWEDVGEKSEAWTRRPTLDPASTMIPSTSPINIASMDPASTMIPSASHIPSMDPASTMIPSTSRIPSTLPSSSPKPSHSPSINVFTIQWITKPPIPSPSMAPSNSLSPSQQFRPSSQPSLSSVSKILQANISSVEAACAGADNVALLANGNEAARTKCLDACSNGLCCYTEQLGYSSFIESCYIGNEAVCEGYSTCLSLLQSAEITLNTMNETSTGATLNSSVSNGTNADFISFNSSTVFNETTAANNNFTSLNTSIVFDGPPLNSSTVSNEAIAINFNATQYSNSMMPGDESSTENTSLVTISTNEAITNSTTNTALSTVTNTVIIPPPPSDLAALCALSQGRFCTEVCKYASCCFEEAPELNCVTDNEEACQGYAPCSVLYQQGS